MRRTVDEQQQPVWAVGCRTWPSYYAREGNLSMMEARTGSMFKYNMNVAFLKRSFNSSKGFKGMRVTAGVALESVLESTSTVGKETSSSEAS
jgi:hypothetical protein